MAPFPEGNTGFLHQMAKKKIYNVLFQVQRGSLIQGKQSAEFNLCIKMKPSTILWKVWGDT